MLIFPSVLATAWTPKRTDRALPSHRSPVELDTSCKQGKLLVWIMDLASTVRKACAGTRARCTWQRRKRSRPYDRTGRTSLGATRPSRTSSLLRQWMSHFCCTSRACTSSLSLSDQSLLQSGCCTSPRGAQGIVGDERDVQREVYGEEVWVEEVENDEEGEDENEEEEQDDNDDDDEEEEEEEEEDSKEEKGEMEMKKRLLRGS